jgi:predicted ATPase
VYRLGRGIAKVSKRIVFTFDEKSLGSLEQVKKRGKFSSLGTAVRESIQINQELHDQAAEGFSEVVVRNPKTKQEKTIVIPSLRASKVDSGAG